MGILDIDENEDPVVRQMAAQKAMQYYVQNQGRPGALAASILGSRYGFRPDARAEMTQNAAAKMRNQSAEMDLQRDQYDFEAEKNVRGMLQQFDWTKPKAQETFVQELMKNGRFKEAQVANKLFSNGGASYGGNLTQAFDADGRPVFLQTGGPDGVRKVEGYSPLPRYKYVTDATGKLVAMPDRGDITPRATGIDDGGFFQKDTDQRDKRRQERQKQFQDQKDAYDKGTMAYKQNASDLKGIQESISMLLADPDLNKSVGYGSYISVLPETSARKINAKIEALKSQITLGKLMAMKQASATGASGLGSTTEKELDMLANSLGALDPKVDAGEFRNQLAGISQRLGAIMNSGALAQKQRDDNFRQFTSRQKAEEAQDVPRRPATQPAPGDAWKISPATQSKRDQTRAQILTQEYADEQSLLEQAKKSGDPNKVLLHQKNLEALEKEMGNARVSVPTSASKPKTSYTLTGRAKMMKPEQKAAIDRIIQSGDAAAIQKLRDNGLLQ